MIARLPVFVDLRGRRVLVAGGGAAAGRKLPSLLAAGARVTLIAPHIDERVRRLLEKAQGQSVERRATAGDVTADYAMLFPLTNDAAVNRRLSAAARAARVWVCGCSDPADSDFHMAATIDCGPVRIAVSTGGTSPRLARRVARALDAILRSEQ